MAIPTNELLLALRSPKSGWLAAMVCALEEAVQDPDFSDHHRDLLHLLLAANTIPATVASAASDRLTHFEHAVDEMNEALFDPIAAFPSAPVASSRPKLTLVGSVAA